MIQIEAPGDSEYFREMRVGLIGASTMADKNHLPVIGATRGLAVDWVWDIDPDRANDLAGRHRIKGLRNLDEAANKPVDIVLITSPYGTRAAAYGLARDIDAAVLVEKPFARTMARHLAISGGFEPHHLGVGLQRRYHGAVVLARRLIQEAPLGPLVAMSCQYGGVGHRLGGGYASDFNLAGGGLIFNLAVHDLDLSLFMSDARAVSVDSAHMEFEAGLDIHTRAKATVTLADARDIPMEIIVSSLEETERSIRLDFAECSAWLRPYRADGPLEIRARQSSSPFLVTAPEPEAGAYSGNQTLSRMWAGFRDGLNLGEPSRVAAARTALTTDLIDRLYVKAGAPAHPLDIAP
jgi:predicted dehydrogenase